VGTWDPAFFRKSPLFWPIARAASQLERFASWPGPEDLTGLFEREPPVRFVRAARPSLPRPDGPRRRRVPPPADARYDARIALERTVSTRAESWHDLLNALVWTSFPRAKLALHTRQHQMIAARLQDDLKLPGARTKEQDAVAMLDEGGVAVLCSQKRRDEVTAALKLKESEGGALVAALIERGDAIAVLFGHALYEKLAVGGPERVRGAAYVVGVDSLPATARAQVDAADRALAELLAREAPIGRADLGSIAVGENLCGPLRTPARD